ncbi:MAG: hypothetical protein OEU54_05060 [Gemmatimonadota bacterium]|nr:hypothetical protein [Gemmatimonadota bacterium]
MSDAYAEALARHGLEDVQPLYRQLLLRLKNHDAAAYEEAVGRYLRDVESAVDSAEDPVAVWVAYGVWLAPRLAAGTLKAVDANGLAIDAESPPPLGPLLMHLPADPKTRGLVLAMPAEASPAQKETAALLCA